MGNISDINTKLIAEVAEILGASVEVDTEAVVPHTEGVFTVGQKYEMYAPCAAAAAIALGINWHDTLHYSFTYEGLINMRGHAYLATKDIHYGGSQVPAVVQEQFDKLASLLNGTLPLCPVEVGAKAIRPYTGE